MGHRDVHSIELVEIYLESFVSTLESFPGRIATGFSQKQGFFTSFLPVFTFFLLFPTFFEKGGEVIQIELDELYLESSTASLESVPERSFREILES